MHCFECNKAPTRLFQIFKSDCYSLSIVFSIQLVTDLWRSDCYSLSIVFSIHLVTDLWRSDCYSLSIVFSIHLFVRMVLMLYMCTFCAAVFPGWCSCCTCVHYLQQVFFRMVLKLYMCTLFAASFFQDGAQIVHVTCTFCVTVFSGWCSHYMCVHFVQQFYQDGARIEAAFRKYFHRADPEQKGDSVEVIICHANVIRYFICR